MHLIIVNTMQYFATDSLVQDGCLHALTQLIQSGYDSPHLARDTTPQILRAMDQHQNDTLVQARACIVFKNIATNDANRVLLVAANVHMKLMRTQVRHMDNIMVQREVCAALHELTNSTSNIEKMELAAVDVGIFESMTRHLGDQIVQANGLAALQKLWHLNGCALSALQNIWNK